MFRVEVIGNLGADAEVKNWNGQNFVSFRVADTNRRVDDQGVVSETTTWFSCTMNGDQSALMPYLKKGQRVFVRGRGYMKVYDSAAAHAKVASCDVRVTELELVGGSKEEREAVDNYRNCVDYIFNRLRYPRWEDIPPFNPTPTTPASVPQSENHDEEVI